MRLYEGTIEQFNNDVLLNRIADKLKEQYGNYYQKNVGDSEYNAWRHSLNLLNNSFTYSSLANNQIIIEYELPYSTRRIDVLIFGKDHGNNDSVVLIELKQWSNNSVKDSPNEGNVITYVGQGWREVPHPSLQVQGYHFDLYDFMTIFQDNKNLNLHSCAYCHNYSKQSENNALFQPKFEKFIEKFPVFTKEDVESLGNYLKERLNKSNGLEVFNRFITSPIRPSKRLLDHTSEMINKQQVFNLIDDQIAAYNAIMHKAKTLVKTGRKSVIIIKGGPGTGKSVIALEVMAELMRKGIPVFHATGSSAFTNTLRDILGPRINGFPVRRFFNFFFSFTKHADNSVDVLICDEAHRIRKDSNDYGVPSKYKSRVPQVDDLIRPAKLSIFLLDENQVVRPKEIGSVKLIKESAEKFSVLDEDIAEFELKTQFRCSGSDAYLQWVDKTLGLVDTEITRFDARMEFRIVESPHELKRLIDEKNSLSPKKDKARIVAGFCWPWSKPRQDGSLVNDVKIGDFEMPWEKKDEFWTWATRPEGASQVGTVYTSQGFEYDYIGIIWGPDLVFDPKTNSWVSKPEKSFDNAVKQNNTELATHLKHVYRVLLSRAHKGVFVYFMDKDTEQYFKFALTMGQGLTDKILRFSDIINEQEDVSKKIIPEVEKEKQFVSYLPVYSLSAACGKFGEGTDSHEEGWIKVDIGKGKLDEKMFVSRVFGHSMEPLIQDGSYCIFRADVIGGRQGKIVLVQHHSIHDPETGGSYTVKKYTSKKKYQTDETWEHEEIALKPLNKAYEPIVISAEQAPDFKIIAEFVDAIRTKP